MPIYQTPSSSPTGSITHWTGSSIPTGFLLCDGSAVSRSTFPVLFSTIGILHGQGDGSTTFNLPDCRGKFLRGVVASSLNSITGSGTVSSNNATFTAHGVQRTGFKVRLSSGTLSGLSSNTTYFAIVVDANTLAFASSQANAVAGTKISISGSNSGVLTQWEDPDASSRLAPNVGGATSGVGSIQDHQIASHLHNSGLTGPLTWNFAVGGNGITSGTTDAFGGNETRPQNVYVNYIIKT